MRTKSWHFVQKFNDSFRLICYVFDWNVNINEPKNIRDEPSYWY